MTTKEYTFPGQYQIDMLSTENHMQWQYPLNMQNYYTFLHDYQMEGEGIDTTLDGHFDRHRKTDRQVKLLVNGMISPNVWQKTLPNVLMKRGLTLSILTTNADFIPDQKCGINDITPVKRNARKWQVIHLYLNLLFSH